jgi:hypothetical protein
MEYKYKFITLRLYEHQTYNFGLGTSAPKEIISTRDLFPTFNNNSTSKKRNSTQLLPIVKRGIIIIIINNNNNNRVPKWFLYTCVYFIY